MDDALRLTDPIAKKRLVDRLARIEGQLRGLCDMINNGDPCEQIAHQMSAARAALSKVFAELIADELENLEHDSVAADPVLHARLKALVKILEKYS
jgi:CsoR family transcriptional regulator, copper-sensing transcriptional repressor